MSDKIYDIKPYLKDIENSESKSIIITREKEKLIQTITNSATSEAQLMQIIKNKEDRVLKEFEDDQLDFIPVPDLINAFKNLVIQHKEEIKIWQKSWLTVATEYDALAEQKVRIVPVATSKTSEEKDMFVKDKMEMVKGLYKQFKRVKPIDKDDLIRTFLDSEAKDETERIFLMEMIAEYENKMMHKEDEDNDDEGGDEDNIKPARKRKI